MDNEGADDDVRSGTGEENTQPELNSPHNSVGKVNTDTKETKENWFRRCGNWFGRLLSSQCGLEDSWAIHAAGLIVAIVLCWGLMYTLLKVEAAPGGDLFKLAVLVLAAYCTGGLFAMVKLPPLVGMLVAGIALRTVGFFKISGVYLDIVIKLREVALTVILIKAGLGLDAQALLKLSLVVLRLAFIPCLTEALAAALISHYTLGYPWLWGLLLGFMLSAVSPAVVVPVLLSLQERGYGEEKGIATLVVAASSIDDILAISAFGVILGMLFSPGDLTQQILQGPIELGSGLAFGIIWGFLASFIPHRNDRFVTLKRSIMIGFGGLCAVLGAELLHYPGAGPLACIVSTFVACLSWKLQGWSASHNPVSKVFSNCWLVLQPILFGLIGAEIDLMRLDLGTVGYGMAIITGSLFIRVITCCVVLTGASLNWKELIFVNLAWLPKATVQAALGPEALDEVRLQDNPSQEDLMRGSQMLTIAVLSILLTAPLGSIAISVTGPYLLSAKQPSAVEAPQKGPVTNQTNMKATHITATTVDTVGRSNATIV